jgi:hypothetical protein
MIDGKIYSSSGQYIADIRSNQIFDRSGNKLYDLRGKNIYKLSGELVGHLSSAAGDRRLDKSTDKLFPET